MEKKEEQEVGEGNSQKNIVQKTESEDENRSKPVKNKKDKNRSGQEVI